MSNDQTYIIKVRRSALLSSSLKDRPTIEEIKAQRLRSVIMRSTWAEKIKYTIWLEKETSGYVEYPLFIDNKMSISILYTFNSLTYITPRNPNPSAFIIHEFKDDKPVFRAVGRIDNGVRKALKFLIEEFVEEEPMPRGLRYGISDGVWRSLPLISISGSSSGSLY